MYAFARIRALQVGQTLYVRDCHDLSTAGVVSAMVHVSKKEPFVLIKGPKGGVVGITRKA